MKRWLTLFAILALAAAGTLAYVRWRARDTRESTWIGWELKPPVPGATALAAKETLAGIYRVGSLVKVQSVLGARRQTQ